MTKKKSRKYWKRRAKYLKKILEILNASPLINALENCEEELRIAKEELVKRDRQLFYCESKQEATYDVLQEIRRIHEKFMRATKSVGYLEYPTEVGNILKDTEYLTEDIFLKDCEKELRATKELLDIREEQIEEEIKCVARNAARLQEIRHICDKYAEAEFLEGPNAYNVVMMITKIVEPETNDPPI